MTYDFAFLLKPVAFAPRAVAIRTSNDKLSKSYRQPPFFERSFFARRKKERQNAVPLVGLIIDNCPFFTD